MTELYNTSRNRLRIKNEIVGKPMDEWIREASECGLDYGTYRTLIEQGKTFEQVKAAGYHSAAHSKTHMRHR